MRPAFPAHGTMGVQLDCDGPGRNLPMMKASLDKLRAEESEHGSAVHDAASVYRDTGDGMDVSLLEDSLAKTPWERMQANDDALRFADSLRAAMEERDAKSERTDAQTR